MSDQRESFPTLEDASTLEGKALAAVIEGNSISAKLGSLGFAFKDLSGNAVLPQLDAGGGIPISALPLPTGAATEATLATAAASLVSIDNKAIFFPASDYTLDTFRVQTYNDFVTANAELGFIHGNLTAINGKVPSGLTVTSNMLQVDGSGVTQPISAASLPLPSGAATSAKQPALGTAGTASADVITIQGKAGMTAVKVDGSAVTQPISAASLPLPSGAATAANQASEYAALGTIIGYEASIDASTFASKNTLSSIDGKLYSTGSSLLVTDNALTGLLVSQNSTTSGQVAPLVQGAVTTSAPTYVTGRTDPLSLTTAGALRVDSSAVTQPVSGTFWQATQPVSISGTVPVSISGTVAVSAASLPLPTGAATETTLSAFKTANHTDLLSVVSTLGTPMQQTGGSLTAGQGFGTLLASNSWWVKISDGTNAAAVVGTALKVDGSAVTQPISAAALPLPTGAATSALQSTINTTLGSPFQAGGSIGNTTFASTQSGTWNITNVSGTVSLPTGASTAAKQPAFGTAGTASSDVLTIQGKVGMTQVLVDASATTSIILPTGASTSSAQATQIVSLASIDSKLISTGTALRVDLAVTGSNATAIRVDGSSVTQPVSGPLTDTQLRASAVPVSLATLPALVAGSAVIGHVIVDTAPTTTVTGTVSANVSDSTGTAFSSTNPLATKNDALLDFQRLMLAELRAIRLAVVMLATEGGRCRTDDFDSEALIPDLNYLTN